MVKKLLETILPIVFAVLLALALDAWYDNQKQANIVQSSLSDIAMDIRNYGHTNGAHDYNGERLKSLTEQLEHY